MLPEARTKCERPDDSFHLHDEAHVVVKIWKKRHWNNELVDQSVSEELLKEFTEAHIDNKEQLTSSPSLLSILICHSRKKNE